MVSSWLNATMGPKRTNQTVRSLQNRPLSGRKWQSSFTLFSALPVDLRILMWKQCFPSPRLINVDCGIGKQHIKLIRPSSPEAKARKSSAFNKWYEPNTKPSPASSICSHYPTILHVCRESRDHQPEREVNFKDNFSRYSVSPSLKYGQSVMCILFSDLVYPP